MLTTLEKTELNKLEGNEITYLRMGSDVVELSALKLQKVAIQVSRALTYFPHTMLQFSAGQLLASMENGKAILVLSANGGLLAFGQIWPYEKKNAGPILEFGSWLSFAGGCGTEVLLSVPTLAKLIDPNAHLIAIVEKGNAKAQGVIQTYGGKYIGSKESLVIKNPQGSPAQMNIFDITNITKDGAIAAGLVQKLGVPKSGVPNYLSGLYAAFGNEKNPVQKAIDYLNFKMVLKGGELI